MLDSQAKVNEGLIKDQADDLVSQMADMSIGEFVYIFYHFWPILTILANFDHFGQFWPFLALFSHFSQI